MFKSLIATQVKRSRVASKRGLGLSNERGVTIIELIVAVSVFAIVAAGFTLAMGTGLTLTRNNRNRTIAANLASVEMDTIRSADFETLPLGEVERTETVDGIEYTIQRDTEWVSKTAETSACDTPDGDKPAFLRATVSVLWPNMSGARPATSQTILTPPVGVYDPASGHIAVKVLDSAAQPASGHLVTVTGPSSPPPQVTANGCAFFAYLAPGSYAVALGTSGHVDGEGNPTPSQAAAVSIGSITSVQFDYDDAATLELTLGDDASYPVPTLNGLDVTVANPALLLGTKVFAGSGNLRTIADLYPYADGYQAWAGDCPENDPEGLLPDGSRIYPGPPEGLRAAAVATLPGQTTPGNVVMKKVEVRVTNSGVPMPGEQVTADFAGDGTCWSFNNADLGVTDVNGVVRASLPYGMWEFEAVGEDVFFVLDPTAADPALVDVID